MPEPNPQPATVPEQPEAKPPLRKSMPVVIALVAIVALIGIANVSSLLSGSKKSAPASALPMRPAAPNAQQVSSFEIQQQMIDFDKYIGLDPMGTTGLATKVDHGYLMAFGAAAAIGGLGGLAQIGNNGSILDPSTQIRNGISSQTAAEGEQVLNHFLNRLPIITLKEGSRARVYIGRDILIPSYAEHHVDPAL